MATPRATRRRALAARAAAGALLALCALARPAGARLAAAERRLAAARPAARAALLDLLRIPSVSSAHAHRADVAAAADWLAARMADAGLENVGVMSTNVGGAAVDGGGLGGGGEMFHPVVYADWMHAEDPGAPTLLIYGHVDVQPADPRELWTTPPFEPQVRDGKLYARGASDDKGHMYVPIVAVEAWLKSAPDARLPLNVKFLIESEEEVGSPHLPAFLRRHAAKFAADYVVSADGGQVAPDQPGLCTGLRGSVALQVDVYGGASDAHSGTFGGGVANPLHALADLLASMRRREDGALLIPGFYDAVEALTDEERADFARYATLKPVDALLATIGANETFGEGGFSFYERTWARPTVEVVGMWGGFTGDGMKTVLPAEAHAKLSARLVGKQDPAAAARQIISHLQETAASIPGVRVEVTKLSFEAQPYVMSKGGVGNRAAARVLTDVYDGVAPVYFRMGGSIPVTGILRDVLGVETVMFAFGHNDENVHAPDEFARLSSLDRGELAYTRLLSVLAEEHKLERGKAAAARDEL